MLSNEEILGMLLMGALFGYIMYFGFSYLTKGDRYWNRVSQCPPHEWESQYRDPTERERLADPMLTHVYCGLRCGKCKRMPMDVGKPTPFNSGPWGI